MGSTFPATFTPVASSVHVQQGILPAMQPLGNKNKYFDTLNAENFEDNEATVTATAPVFEASCHSFINHDWMHKMNLPMELKLPSTRGIDTWNRTRDLPYLV